MSCSFICSVEFALGSGAGLCARGRTASLAITNTCVTVLFFLLQFGFVCWGIYKILSCRLYYLCGGVKTEDPHPPSPY